MTRLDCDWSNWGQWALLGWCSRPGRNCDFATMSLTSPGSINTVGRERPILWGWWGSLPGTWLELWLCFFCNKYMSCWCQPLFLGVKKYTKKRQKIRFPSCCCLPESQGIPESFPGFPFSSHQLFSGLVRRCLCHGISPMPSATFLSAALLLSLREASDFLGPFTAETPASVLPTSCPSGSPGSALS